MKARKLKRRKQEVLGKETAFRATLSNETALWFRRLPSSRQRALVNLGMKLSLLVQLMRLKRRTRCET